MECQNKNEAQIPIILIHGTLNNASKMNTIKKVLEEQYPNRKIVVTDAYLMITSFLDNGNRLASYTFKQIEDGIAKLAVENNQSAYTCIDIVGHSQGGFLSRVYTQLYSGRPMKNGNYPAVRRLVSLAGVQAGFHCPDSGAYKSVSKFCKGLEGVSESLVRSRLMSWFFTALTYFRDPRLPALVPVSANGINSSTNNLHPLLQPKNVSQVILDKLVYHTNVLGEGRDKIEDLELFATFGSSSDKTLSPWQTSIFGFFAFEGQNIGMEVVPMNKTPDYYLNTYGLFTLNQNSSNSTPKRLIRRETTDMSHIAFRDDETFIKRCVAPLLANKSLSEIMAELNKSTLCGKEPTDW